MEDKFKQIDELIKTKKYSSCKENGYYNKCNIFLDDIARDFFGITLPRAKDVSNPNIMTSSGGDVRDWPENPMPAYDLDDYYEERSKLASSGVEEIPLNKVNKYVKKGELVLVVGKGHATLAAPNKKPWPLIYRSDIASRGKDKRTRVGIKPSGGLKFYRIEPKIYNEFNELLLEMGLTEKDVHSRYLRTQSGEYAGENENYKLLHKLRKGNGK